MALASVRRDCGGKSDPSLRWVQGGSGAGGSGQAAGSQETRPRHVPLGQPGPLSRSLPPHLYAEGTGLDG